MNKYLVHTFYLFDMPKVNVICHLYLRILESKLPHLAKMFEDLNLTVSIFLFPWIMCLFSNTFPLDLSARIWDSYFLYGDFFLMKVCLGISAVIYKQI